MAAIEIFQFPMLSDNYGVLIHVTATGETACIDAGDAGAIMAALDAKGWSLTHLLITHHHWDHTQGLLELKEKTGCQVIGPEQRSQPIRGLDHMLWDGATFSLADSTVRVIATPGHTTDMINYYIPSEAVVFTGDTLFPLGCGRLFEGDANMMWESLSKLAVLPAETLAYCAHEYTKANADFAVTVDPGNAKLRERRQEIARLRANGQPTVPTSIRQELETNPFLRASDPGIRAELSMETASDADVFAEIRNRKDRF